MEGLPNLTNDALKPSVAKIEFGSKQIFNKNVDKINVTFDREEDMLVMCLSTFIHDFAHDFNFFSMHSRILKKNQALFQSMGITIGNGILKKFVLPEMLHRDIIMYDDDKFKDIQEEKPTNFTKSKNNYYKMLRSYESSVMEGGAALDIQDQGELKFAERLKKFKDQELETQELEEPIKLKPEFLLATSPSEVKIETDFTHLEQPLTKEITDTSIYTSILNAYTNDADFLTFFSSLTLYVANYLNCYGVEDKFREHLSNIEGNDKKAIYNLIMHNAIITTLEYIINDFVGGKLDGETYYDEPIEVVHEHANLFALLLMAFKHIELTQNKEFLRDSLETLNSKDVLQQFIIYYSGYLTSKSMDEFLSIKKGGDPEEDKEKLKEEIKEEIKQELRDEIKEGEIEITPPPPSNVIYLTEKIAVTHNNLLTTITRGIFLKLGIWQKIGQLKGVEDESFDEETISYLTFENLKNIYPIDNTITNGHLNNELLILEIIILKQLLLELSPFKMYIMGAKIDDRLKDYMDAFYLANYNFVNQIVNTEAISETNKEIDEYTSSIKDINENELKFYNLEEDSPDFGSMKGGEPEDITDSITEEAISIPASETSAIPEILEKIEEPILPAIPIILEHFKNAYDLNMRTTNNLINSRIKPIEFDDMNGKKTLTNLYDILKYNQTLIHRVNEDGTNSDFYIAAPKMKFVINNASKVTNNINGIKLVLPKKLQNQIEELINKYLTKNENGEYELVDISINDELVKLENELNDVIAGKEGFEGIDEKKEILKGNEDPDEVKEIKDEIKTIERMYKMPLENEIFLLNTLKELDDKEKIKEYLVDIRENAWKWFKSFSSFLGIYKSINRGVFCPGSSMMDAMDNCSLRHGTSEPKEVGTTNCDMVYEGNGKKISYGGTIIYYNQQYPPQLNANIDYRLICNDGSKEDIASITTNDIQVSESKELNARIAYRGVIEKLKLIFAKTYDYEMSDTSELNDLSDEEIKLKMIEKLSKLWNAVQYNNSVQNFNNLLGSTAIKTLGDFLQECQATYQWGGYVNNSDAFVDTTKDLIEANKGTDRQILPIYRSVSEGGKIVPYDNDGNALRLGIQGDRPSGFRSIYILLNASSGINEHCITGYMHTMGNQKPSRTLLVTRNLGEENTNGLKGIVVYVTPNANPDRFSIDLETKFTSPRAVKDKDKESKGFQMATTSEIPSVIETTGIDIPVEEIIPKPKKTKPKTKKTDIILEEQTGGKKTKRAKKNRAKNTKRNKKLVRKHKPRKTHKK